MNERRPRTPAYRAIVLALGLFLVAHSAAAQYPEAALGGRPACSGEGLDANTFAAILSQRFSALVSPKTQGIPGSFLGVDVKDAQASVAESFVATSGVALTVQAHAGVNDGAAAIFNDATLSPKFGGAVQVHFLQRMKQTLQFTAASCDSMELLARKADEVFAVRLAEIRANGAIVQRRLDRAALAEKAAKIEVRLDSLRKYPPKAPADSLLRDSLRLDSARVFTRRQWLDSIAIPDSLTEILAAYGDRSKAYDVAKRALDIRGFSFGWWSIGGSLENASFNLFDPAAALTAQVTKRTFLTRAVSLTYSRIWLSAFEDESRYLAIGVRAGWEDNLADLTKVEITDRQQYAPPPNERFTEEKSTAYQGAYQNDLETFRLSADYYQFVVPQDRLAFHVFPSFAAKMRQIGEVALGAGVLLSARNTENKTSVANAELFFNLPDLGNVEHSTKGPWQRGSVGLRVTFPLKFTPQS